MLLTRMRPSFPNLCLRASCLGTRQLEARVQREDRRQQTHTCLETLRFLGCIIWIPANGWGILNSEHTQWRQIVAVVDGMGRTWRNLKSLHPRSRVKKFLHTTLQCSQDAGAVPLLLGSFQCLAMVTRQVPIISESSNRFEMPISHTDDGVAQ